MPDRLEIAFKQSLIDPEGESICQKAKNYLGLKLDRVRTVNVVTVDAGLSREQLQTIQTEIFTNPVTQVSSYDPLNIEFN